MNLKKNLGRVATAFLATAMLASLTAVPASADTPTDGVWTSDTGITAIEFDKVLMLPEKVKTPAVGFTFTLTAADATSGETTTGANNTILEVKDGVQATAGNDTITTKDVTFTAGAPTSAADPDNDDNMIGVNQVMGDVSLDVSGLAGKFPYAGVYKYTLTETFDADNADRADEDDFTLGHCRSVYLYVSLDDTGATYISGVEMYINTATGTKDAKADGNFYNFYMLDGDVDDPDKDPDPENPDPDHPGGDDPTPRDNEMTVQKTVTGTMGDKGKAFAFTMTIDPAVDTKVYNVVYEYNNGTDDTPNWVEGSRITSKDAVQISELKDGVYTVTFQLAHNERVHIYGLSENEAVTATEADYTTNGGYQTTVTGGEVDDTNKNKTSVTFTKDADNDVVYTNKLDTVSPTGLAMDIAPYALLVVVAAGACFVFLRKRREDD